MGLVQILLIFLFLAAFFTLYLVGRLLMLETLRQRVLWVVLMVTVLGSLFGDDIVTLTYFKRVCPSTADGLVQERSVSGFYVTDSTPRDIRRYLDQGYEFIETKNPEGGYHRYMRDGRILPVERLESAVALKHYSRPEFLGVRVYGDRIVDLTNEKTLAFTGTASTTGGRTHEIFQKIIWEKPLYMSCDFASVSSGILLGAIPPQKKELLK